MKVVIEYVLYNLSFDEINNVIKQMKTQHQQKYGYSSWYNVIKEANVEFFDKVKNRTKND